METNATPSVLALIPARAGSKGVPGKNIRHLAGRPLIGFSCDCALQSQSVTRTIVTTDCPNIAAIARDAGAETPFLRPADLANDTSPTVDTIDHALRWLRERESWMPEVVVLLQPTAPLRLPADVDDAVNRLIDSDADSVVSVCPVDTHYHPEWQFHIRAGELSTVGGVAVGAIPTRRQVLEATYVRNGAIYAFRHASFQRHRSIYGDRCLAHEMPRARSINIDTIADFEAAEQAMEAVLT